MRFLFAALLFAFLTTSSLAASFYLDSVCYVDPPTLLAAFDSKYPLFSASGDVMTLAFPSTISLTGLISYTVNYNNPILAVAFTAVPNTLQLSACDPVVPLFSVKDVVNLLFVFGFIFSWYAGFKSGQMR